MKINTEVPLPVMSESAHPFATESTLRIEGLVSEARWLKSADLINLPRINLTETFSCDEQWAMKSQTWCGPRLIDVINLAGLLTTAKYVRVGAGDYVVPILLADASEALLADSLNGQPLSPEHGAPWRIALPGAQCFTSVKWVDRLEITAVRGDNSGARLTSKRLRALKTEAAT